MQYEERKWLKYVHKMIAAQQKLRRKVKGRGQVIDKKGEKVPESARNVRV